MTAESRARTALRAVGLDPDAKLQRALSQANETWLGDGFALRVNFRGDLGRLEREAVLARRLPPAVRYPDVLHYGRDNAIEWLFTRRVPGIELARAWADLDAVRRERAIVEVAHALRALHRVDPTGLPGDGELAPPHVLPLPPLIALIEELADARKLDRAFAIDLAAFVRERWDAFDERSVGLVHGDPHLENVLWDGEHVSAMIDLEWSRPSYLECDLETLLSCCDHPAVFVSADYEDRARAEDYADVPGWLLREYAELFDHPRLDDRLAILHVSRTLTIVDEDQLNPRTEAHLRAVLDGTTFLYAMRMRCMAR